MAPHNERTRTATEALKPLQGLQGDDLNEVRGGFTWWYGYFPQPKVIFASDYLLQVTGQVSRMLNMAAWHEKEFNEAWFAETMWFRQQAAKGVHPFSGRGEPEEKRALRIDAALTGFFQSCGSVLDSIAASAIGILGIQTDLVTASWSTIDAVKRGPERTTRKLLADEGSVARTLQDDAVGRIYESFSGQPNGWLTWTLGMRNVFIHRAQRFELRRFYRRSSRDDLQYVLHLPKDPQLTDAEGFVLGHQVEDLLLWEHAGTTMAGVLDRLVTAVSETAEILQSTWERRRTDPELIKQPESQWKDVYPVRRNLSGFSGFAEPLPHLPNEQAHVAPDVAKRMRAGKLFDADRGFWARTLPGFNGT